MSLLSKLGGLFTGGASAAVGQVAGIVERFKPGEVKQHEMTTEDDKLNAEATANARAMTLATHDTWFDAAVDGFNRMVRPGITVLLIGSVVGWWSLPAPGSIDPFYLANAERVLVFWFGGRALFRDLPDAIAYYKQTAKVKG